LGLGLIHPDHFSHGMDTGQAIFRENYRWNSSITFSLFHSVFQGRVNVRDSKGHLPQPERCHHFRINFLSRGDDRISTAVEGHKEHPNGPSKKLVAIGIGYFEPNRVSARTDRQNAIGVARWFY